MLTMGFALAFPFKFGQFGPLVNSPKVWHWCLCRVTVGDSLCSYYAFRKQLWHLIVYVALLICCFLCCFHWFISRVGVPARGLTFHVQSWKQIKRTLRLLFYFFHGNLRMAAFCESDEIRLIVLNLRLYQAIDNGNGIVCEQPNGAEIVELVTWTLKAAQ